ncbi:Larval cuticle protein A2B [Vespula maculifrons]|uniref:Larval cuticle protein A2B n=1 Tax=Vespula maculifrons TaxID=7453 RepID=A0ABD2C835_VESMC|nr:uncharacterized protein LOC127067848 isoform X1 [Vespula vulgaris]
MSTIDSHRLTEPEFLSEYELCQILKNRCIEIRNFERLSKMELIELYKRVAMPLPQRQLRNINCKEANRSNLNQKPVSEIDQNMTVQLSDKHDNTSITNLHEKKRKVFHENLIEPKSFMHETKSVLKKIRLTSISKREIDCNGINKHEINEENEVWFDVFMIQLYHLQRKGKKLHGPNF